MTARYLSSKADHFELHFFHIYYIFLNHAIKNKILHFCSCKKRLAAEQKRAILFPECTFQKPTVFCEK